MTVLGTAPWRRAPGLLLRRPALLAAIAGTCALLAVAAASGPLFLSSTGAAALQRRVAAQCPEADRPAVTTLPETGDPIGGALAAAGLPPAYEVTQATVQAPFGINTRPVPLTVYQRSDALDHVRRIRGGGSGLWVSDLEAERQRVRIGDRVTVGGVALPVVGLYQDLAGPGFGQVLPAYWCSWTPAIVPTLEKRPPPFLLADAATMRRLQVALARQPPSGDIGIATTHVSAVDTAPLTLVEADRVLAAQGRLAARLGDSYEVRSGLAEDRRAAGDTRDGVRGAILPVALAGVAVAVLLVAAAASFWADQRRAELRLLGARGVGPAAVAAKAVLEMAVPALAGAAVGWAAAIALVRYAGPADRLEPGAGWAALRAVLPALAAGLVALAAVAGARSGEGGARPRLRRLPWELVLLALAGWTYASLRSRGAVATDSRAVVRVDPRLVLFGLLGMTGAVLLATRLLALGLPWLRRRTADARPPVHLAARRLAVLPAATAAVLAATAVPVAILGYAGSVTRSTDSTVEAKARTYAGTEHASVLNARPAETVPIGDTGTQVSVIRDVVTPAGAESMVLGIDPATFARFAYPIVDLDPLVRRLDAPGVPAIAVRCPQCGARVPMTLGRTRLTAEVVGTAEVFPGIRVRDAALLVVPRAALSGVDPYANRVEEIWTDDAHLAAAARTLERLGRTPIREVSPGQFLGATQLLPVTWTFGYLQALAVLIGLIAGAGLMLFLAARQRATLVSYVLLRRIGMSRRGHLGALAGELVGLLAVGWLLGAAAAVGFAAAVSGLLDVNPLYPPGPRLAVPAAVLGIGAGVLLAVALAGALGTQRVADAAEPATLLRGV